MLAEGRSRESGVRSEGVEELRSEEGGGRIQDWAWAGDKGVVIATVPDQSLRERALRSLGQLPPFSPILNRLLASLAREDVSWR